MSVVMLCAMSLSSCYSTYPLSWILECYVRSHTRSKALNVMFVTHLYVRSCNRRTLNCREIWRPVQRRREQSENQIKKRLNSQSFYSWDYGIALSKKRESRTFPEVKKRNLEATPPSPSQLGLVFVPPCRDLRVRARMECHKKGGFCTPRKKGTEAAHRNLLIIMASTGIHESISMQTVSNHVIYLLYDKKVYYCRRFWWLNFWHQSHCFQLSNTACSVKTSDGVFFEGRTSQKGVLSEMGFRYDEMINNRRFTLHQFVCFNYTAQYMQGKLWAA